MAKEDPLKIPDGVEEASLVKSRRHYERQEVRRHIRSTLQGLALQLGDNLSLMSDYEVYSVGKSLKHLAKTADSLYKEDSQPVWSIEIFEAYMREARFENTKFKGVDKES